MKARIIIYGGMVVVLFALYLWWSAPRRATEELRSNQIASLLASNPVPPEVLTNPAVKSWVRPPGISDADWRDATTVRSMMLALNKKIEFHARVVDQNGVGVSGALMDLILSGVDEAKVSKEFPNMKMGSEIVSDSIQLSSDSDGWCHLTGRRGRMVVVEGLHPGDAYLWQQNGYLSFDYDGGNVLKPYEDPTKGYTFHLWKKGNAERIVPISLGVNMNNTVQGQWVSNYFVGFIPARVEWTNFTGADLHITGIRRPSGNPDRPVEFTFTLTIPDGGMVLSEDAYAYHAPITGYQSSWSFENKPQINPPDFPWTKTAYVKLRGGKMYAGFRLGFCNGGFDFSFVGHVNPFGSRNLEPDLEKLILDPEEIRRLDEESRRR